MVKFIFLTLTMILITSTAALIGLSEIPVPAEDIKENIPIEREEEEEREEVKPPRFILDKPLDDYLSLEDDPSAAVKQSEEESLSEAPLKVPTKGEIKDTAQPYIEEIIEIKDTAFANIASLEKKIAVDYLSMPSEERDSAPTLLFNKYMPRVNLILSTCDEDVERALNKLKSALYAINADLSTVENARKSYEEEKEEKLKYYEDLLASLGQDIDLTSKDNEGSVSPAN